MSLYYEEDPANDNSFPQLPPLLKPNKILNGTNVFSKAISSTSNNETGTVFFSEDINNAEMAILLNPEIHKKKCNEMLYVMMVAAGDAIGALAPPEVAVTYSFPGFIYLNKGEAGIVNYAIDNNCNENEIPEWLVIGFKIKIKDTLVTADHPDPDITSLETEGAGFISRTRMIESLCRHFLAWLNQWEEEGFKPVHKLWNQRLDPTKKVININNIESEFVGLDENGIAILKRLNGEKFFLSPNDYFNQISEIKLK